MSPLSDFGFRLPNKHTPNTIPSGKEMHHHTAPDDIGDTKKPCGSSVDDYKFYLQVMDFSVHTVKWNSTVELQRKVHYELNRISSLIVAFWLSVSCHMEVMRLLKVATGLNFQ